MQFPRRPIEWLSGFAFVAALVLGLAGPVAQMVGLDPVQALDHVAVLAVGAIITMAGIALTFVAQLEMGDSWRVGVDHAERTALVRSGLFRWVRNPIFTAMGTTALGVTLLVPNPLAIAAVALLVVGLELQVRLVEAPHLRMTHGNDYESYAGSTGGFVPGVSRLHPS